MATKYYSKVIINGQTYIDLTGDTVTAASLLSGYTAHGKDGRAVNGTCTFNADTSSDTVTASSMLTGYTAHDEDGNSITGTIPNVGAQTSTIETKSGSVTINRGYHDGTGNVTLKASAVADLTANNIRSGKTILGVTGTMSATEGLSLQEKSVTPTFSAQEVNYDSPTYNGLSKVNVAAIPVSEVLDNTSGGYIVTVG